MNMDGLEGEDKDATDEHDSSMVDNLRTSNRYASLDLDAEDNDQAIATNTTQKSEPAGKNQQRSNHVATMATVAKTNTVSQ